MSALVRITDVAPRDGLQNEPDMVPVAGKVGLVRRLAAAGVDEIEVSSFVSRKWIPQLGDAAEVFAALRDLAGAAPVLSALVPNEQGMAAALRVNERAGAALLGKVAVFTAASETFAQKNTNASIAETLERFEPVIRLAHGAGLLVRGYVSCAIACPFEGPISPQQAARVGARLLELGVDELDLADTIGAGEPDSLEALLHAVLASTGAAAPPRVTLHLHDTRGQAAGCVRRALELGVRSFDGAAGGLGGCPYASTATSRAPGNLATETLVGAVEQAGLATRVNREALRLASELAQSLRSSGGGCGAGGKTV